MADCRCGWDGQGEHPCHGRNYTCRKLALHRFYTPSLRFALAGQAMKFVTQDTWACDECWEDFKKLTEKEHGSVSDE